MTCFRYHMHSNYSLCDSTTWYQRYVDEVVKEGGKGIAFSEHGNIFEWVAKKQYCDKNGIKYVHAIEFYLTQGDKFGNIRDNYHVIAMAKNYEGVKEINTLFSLSYQKDHFYFKPRITFEDFLNISDNVITTSACLGGPLNQIPKTITSLQTKISELDDSLKALSLEYNKAVVAKNATSSKGQKKIEKITQTIQNIEKEIKQYEENIDFLKKSYIPLLKKFDYLEIQSFINSDEQKEYNKLLYKYAKKYGKQLIAATDTHSMNQYEAECRKLLIKDRFKKAGNDLPYEDDLDLTWKTYDELVDCFERQGALPKDVYMEAIENTNKLLDQIESFELDTSFKYNDIPGVVDTKAGLQQRINEKFIDKKNRGLIPKEDTKKYLERIREEFRVLDKIGMTGFILFMSDLVTWVRSKGIPIGPCRGSVGGCLIAYICDIIDLDPIKRNTVFSRFANEDRVELGDIDIDIPPDQRHLVFEYITQCYPETQTARVITFGTQKALGTIDALCRVNNISIPEGKLIKSTFKENFEQLNRKFPEFFDEYKGDVLGFGSKPEVDCIRKYAEKIKYDEKDLEKLVNWHLANSAELRNKYPEIVKYYNGLFGVPISQGMHAAGIIVAPSYINLYSEYGVLRNGEDQIISIDMDLCHDVSLVKYDILGLKQLQILRIACETANMKVPDSCDVDWDDAVVWKHMLDHPVGLFQFEKRNSFELLKKFHPKKIDDMTLVNAALRPSGASYRDDLISKKFNKNPSEQIDELLKDNNGYLVYQEDIIKFLQEICGLSGSQADTVRRGIAHKKEKELEESMPKIIEGYCSKSTHQREEAINEVNKFIQIIKDSSSYMFGRNHATGYSMLGYKCILFRTYFPAEFIVGYLNASKDLDDIVKGDNLASSLDISYLNDPIVRQRKVDIINQYSNLNIGVDDLPVYPKRVIIHRPTFGKSKGNYTFDPVTYSIYKGVGSVKNLSAGSADELYELAKKPQYQNIENKSDEEKKILFYQLVKDCTLNTSVKKNQLEILIKLNFFSAFGPDKTLLRIFNNIGSLTGNYKFENINNKSFKKEDIPFLPIDEEILKSISYQETDKKYQHVDMDEYFEKSLPTFKNESFSLKEQLEFEFEKAGSYLTRVNSKSPIYYIIELKTYNKKNNPYLTLFNLKSGQEERCSVPDAKYYINNQIQEHDLITNCKFENVKKKSKVNGEYVDLGETKRVITAWIKK